MPKCARLARLPAATALALLVACSTTPATSVPIQSPKEAEAGAPGMIPGECEALLNQSREWKFVPGQKWQPSEAGQMLEVMRFFSSYRMVPEKTSDSFRRLLGARLHLSREADQGLALELQEAQVCDPFLPQAFLQAALEYEWPKEQRAEAGRAFHQFLLNQQARELPLLHRGIITQVFVKAVARGFVAGSSGKARALEAWMEREIRENRKSIPAENASAGDYVEGVRRDLILANAIRDRLAALLPLP